LATQAFYDYCVNNWRRAKLYDDVLKHLFTEEELKNMTTGQKLASIYQCTLEQAFQDLSEANAAHAQFETTLALSRPQRVKQPEAVKLILGFLKTMFAEGSFYSVPASVFGPWRAISAGAEAVVENASCETILALTDEAVPEEPPREVTVFFQVLNCRPENRFHMTIPHLASSRSTIAVQECLLVASRPLASEYTLVRSSPGRMSLTFA